VEGRHPQNAWPRRRGPVKGRGAGDCAWCGAQTFMLAALPSCLHAIFYSMFPFLT